MEQMMEYVPNMYATFWALVPPLVAIILALVTKEVYSSLFIGIVIGGLFYGNIFQQGFSFEKSVLHIFEDGLVGVLSDPYNVGILIFLVVLGIMVSMMNKAVLRTGSKLGRVILISKVVITCWPTLSFLET